MFECFHLKGLEYVVSAIACMHLSGRLTLGFVSLLSRSSGAGHLRDDILYYRKELQKIYNFEEKEEHRSYLLDMGIKALRLVLIPTSC